MSPMGDGALASRVAALEDAAIKLDRTPGPHQGHANATRWKLFEEWDILHTEIGAAANSPVHEQLQQSLSHLEKKLAPCPLQNARGPLYLLSGAMRLLGLGIFMAMLAVLVSPALVILTLGEDLLIRRGKMHWNERWSPCAKRVMAWWMLQILGIKLAVEGEQHISPCLVLFTHGSYLDPILLVASYRCGFKALTKAEVFFLPYIGMLGASLGSVPIERRKRDKAIQTLSGLGRWLKEVGDSIVIAPEGTRSKTGNLTSFKKGPFHLQQDLQCDIMLATIGGNHLIWPPAKPFPATGRIYIRYEKPFKPGPGMSREDVMLEVRQGFNRAKRSLPEVCAGPLTLLERLGTCAACAITYLTAWLLLVLASQLRAAAGMNVTQWAVVWLGYTVASTALVAVK
ncbi:unnamed protein product [Chrysoparadoxa australica]